MGELEPRLFERPVDRLQHTRQRVRDPLGANPSALAEHSATCLLLGASSLRLDLAAEISGPLAFGSDSLSCRLKLDAQLSLVAPCGLELVDEFASGRCIEHGARLLLERLETPLRIGNGSCRRLSLRLGVGKGLCGTGQLGLGRLKLCPGP